MQPLLNSSSEAAPPSERVAYWSQTERTKGKPSGKLKPLRGRALMLYRRGVVGEAQWGRFTL